MADFSLNEDSTPPFDEKENWNRIKQDDKSGLERLYSAYAYELMAFGLSIFPNRSLVKDCIQELFIDIWRYRKNDKYVKNVKMYIFRSLGNKIQKELKKEKKRRVTEQSEGFDSLYFPNEAQKGIFNTPAEHYTNLRLIKTLEKLPVRQREVLQYAFFENLSNEQISTMMGINIQSVYTLTWKAICNLRKHYILLLVLLLC